MRAFGATPDAGFTSASGTVAQLRSHSSGGFGVISVPLGNGTVGGGTGVNPIPTGTLNVGDIIRLSFDLFVQTVPTSPTLAFFWNSDSASGTQDTTWSEFNSATVGDVISFSKDLQITSSLTDITTIAPQVQFVTSPGTITPSTNFAQLDNYRLEVVTAVPEPSSLVILSSFGGLFVVRRRWNRHVQTVN